MSEQLKVTIIDTPNYALKPKIVLDEDGGIESRDAFQPFMSQILKVLNNKLEVEFNDPEILFLDEGSGFPIKKELSGQIYLSNMCFSGHDTYHQLNISFNCLEKTRRTWQNKPVNFDYLGMEMFVYLDKKVKELEFDEHFTSSSI